MSMSVITPSLCNLQYDRCSTHVNKNRLFCVQYRPHVLTSGVVSLLPFPDSTVHTIFVLLPIRFYCGDPQYKK